MASENINWWKIVVYVIIAIALFVGGFFLGKSLTKTEPQIITEYIKGDTIEKEVIVKEPVYTKTPVDTLSIIQYCIESGNFTDLFPVRHDTTIVTKSDTSAVIFDWATQRTYDNVLFDVDTLGKCNVTSVVQYNRLSSVEYTYIPVQKVVTRETISKPKYSPFVGVGIMTNPCVDIMGGLFINNWGGALMYQYEWELKKHDFGLNIMYKF